MSRAGELASVEELLRGRGLEFVRARFRLPSLPQLSPSAGFLSCAAGAFLLAKGGAAASFLLAVAGAIILLLDAYGFSPPAWLGPRETRPVPLFGVLGGIAMFALSAGEGVRPAAAEGPRNLAAGWVDLFPSPKDALFRPYFLVYSGDPAEVKYFLSRHRGPVFRGTGLFLELAPAAEGAYSA